MGRAPATIRSWRVRSPARDASAACSSSSSRPPKRRSIACGLSRFTRPPPRARGRLIAGTSAARRWGAAPARPSPRAPSARPAAGGGRACPRSDSPRPSTESARTPNERARATKSGVMQVDALARVALQLLVEAQHAVAAVVHDHGRQRDALLGGGGQLAAGVQEAAVAGDAHHRPRPAQRGAEPLREGAAERAPAERVREPARRRGAMEAAEPVAGDAHVADQRGVGRQRALDRLEEGDRLRVALACRRRGRPGSGHAAGGRARRGRRAARGAPARAAAASAASASSSTSGR